MYQLRAIRADVKTFKSFLIATITLGIAAYLINGRDKGAPLWAIIIGAAIFIGINAVARVLTDRHRDGSVGKYQ